jgi:acylphosphatase
VAQATMTTLDAILKEVYAGRIEEQLTQETVARTRIERTSDGVVETVGGKYVDFPIHVTRNTGIGWRRELELLPAAGNQGYASVHVPLQYGYGRTRITGQVMELADTNVQAFASGLDEEMTRVKDDIAKDENRITYGDGSGLLATVTADGANTVTVDNIQWLEVGMRIDILTRANGATVALARDITAINETTNVVTYNGADVGATTNEGLYREGNYVGGTKREPSGFGNIVSDSLVLHGVDPAVQSKWKAVIRNNPAAAGTPRALSEGIMIETVDAIRVKSGKRPTAAFTSFGVRRAYFNLLTQQRRYTDTKEYAGGFQGLPFNYGAKEIPVVEDPDAPPNKMRFINEPAIKIFRNKEWHWADKDGTVLKWVHDYDAWEGLLKCYYEFGTTQRNSHGSLNDIIEG